MLIGGREPTAHTSLVSVLSIIQTTAELLACTQNFVNDKTKLRKH